MKTGALSGADDGAPAMLALHERTSVQELFDYAMRHGKVVQETPWSKRIFDTCVSVERIVWDITGKYAASDCKLDKL